MAISHKCGDSLWHSYWSGKPQGQGAKVANRDFCVKKILTIYTFCFYFCTCTLLYCDSYRVASPTRCLLA